LTFSEGNGCAQGPSGVRIVVELVALVVDAADMPEELSVELVMPLVVVAVPGGRPKAR
jgi:hypothetical protein